MESHCVASPAGKHIALLMQVDPGRGQRLSTFYPYESRFRVERSGNGGRGRMFPPSGVGGHDAAVVPIRHRGAAGTNKRDMRIMRLDHRSIDG